MIVFIKSKDGVICNRWEQEGQMITERKTTYCLLPLQCIRCSLVMIYNVFMVGKYYSKVWSPIFSLDLIQCLRRSKWHHLQDQMVPDLQDHWVCAIMCIWCRKWNSDIQPYVFQTRANAIYKKGDLVGKLCHLLVSALPNFQEYSGCNIEYIIYQKTWIKALDAPQMSWSDWVEGVKIGIPKSPILTIV